MSIEARCQSCVKHIFGFVEQTDCFEQVSKAQRARYPHVTRKEIVLRLAQTKLQEIQAVDLLSQFRNQQKRTKGSDREREREKQYIYISGIWQHWYLQGLASEWWREGGSSQRSASCNIGVLHAWLPAVLLAMLSCWECANNSQIKRLAAVVTRSSFF